MRTIALTSIILAALATGCALNRPLLQEETHQTATNGVVNATKRSLKVTSFVMWPAKDSVSNQKASLGKTMSTGVDALNQDSGGTNVVNALQAIDSILGKVRP